MGQSNIWISFFVGLVCLPTLLPWIIHHAYQFNKRRRDKKKASLKDKVVLITGASSLLGKALAHAFYLAKCKLILAGQKECELRKIKNDLLNLNVEDVAEPALVVMDPNALNDFKRLATNVLCIHRKLDILVNNDYALPPSGLSLAFETPVALDIKFLVIGYLSHVALTKAFLPSMIKENNGGSIVSISSIHGKLVLPFHSSYTASKHALQAFYECLRAELANDNINICIVNLSWLYSRLIYQSAAALSNAEVECMESHNLHTQVAADRIISAIVNEEQELVLSPLTIRMIILLRHLMPRLYSYIMASRVKRLCSS